jgi:hypothetical protein
MERCVGTTSANVGRKRPANANATRHRYDWSETAPSTAVGLTVARATGQSPSSIPPLYRFVDADALDALVGAGGTPGDTPTTVTFDIASHRMTVRATGDVTVRPE